MVWSNGAGGKGLAVTVIGESKKGKESSETLSQLKAYKAICDELLPAMRNGSHLHNLIFRFAGNCTLVLHRKEDPNQVMRLVHLSFFLFLLLFPLPSSSF